MKPALLFGRLILPLVSLMVALVITIGWLSQRMAAVDKAQRQQQQVQTRLTAVTQKIMQSAQDKQWIARYSAEYSQLQRNGFIGEDQRLVWNQALISAGTRLGLTDLSFDIAPQKPHSPDVMAGTLTLMDTAVQFTAGIPHEGVFAQLLHDLRMQGHGIFTVRECTLSHTLGMSPLQAQCVFEWHTLAQGAGA